MRNIVDQRVDVVALYASSEQAGKPLKIRWGSRTYDIKTLGFHHTKKQGETLLHIYSVTDGALFFKLAFNTNSLIWTLEEVSDGIAD